VDDIVAFLMTLTDGYMEAPARPLPGLEAVRLDLSMATASPNPFRTSTELRLVTPVADQQTVGVFDLSGRQVRSLTMSGSRVLWDGRTDAGSPAPAGIYFFRAPSGAGTTTCRILRLP